MKKVYLGSIALEKNRWEPGRIPTYPVSDYTQRAKADGFNGIELWQYHYLSAGSEERRKLLDAETDYIFNSYMSLADGITEELVQTADAIRQLQAKAVKYNFGSSQVENSREAVEKQTQTLLRFADMLPADVKLLCECHAGTLGADPEQMGETFAKLDARFGAIIHLMTPLDLARECFDCYGDRICHIHSSFMVPDVGFQCLDTAESKAQSQLQYYIMRGFDGTVTVEFTQDGDKPDQYYANALRDLRVWRNLLK